MFKLFNLFLLIVNIHTVCYRIHDGNLNTVAVFVATVCGMMNLYLMMES